jgi:LAO/AO transport system kinase
VTPSTAALSDLIDRGAQGEVAATSQLITAVESRTAGMATLDAIYARSCHAHIIGITGAPGSGKSTLVAALARELRTRDMRVAVVAVDPSSSISGGAILGDRIRMGEHTLDPGIFVRSMSSRGVLGGVSRATVDAVAVLDATGWAVVIVETVGVGQAEVEIAQIAHSTVVVSVPGLGDDIQAIKAGLLEIADVHVVNKIDRPDAHKTIKDLLGMLRLSEPGGDDQWSAPVLGTSAVSGEGVPALADALSRHREWLGSSDHLRQRERAIAIARIRTIAKASILERLQDPANTGDFLAIVDQVVSRALSPYRAAALLLSRVSDVVAQTEGSTHD